MRVGLVVTGGVDASGRERVIPTLLWLIDRLARQHDVHVFVLRHHVTPTTYRLRGATVHDLGRTDRTPGLGTMRQVRRLARAMSGIGPFDVVHAYWAIPAGLVATRVARRLGIPAIVTFDSGEFVSLPDIGYGLQRRWIDRRRVMWTARHATRATVSTEFMARLAAAHRVDRVDLVPLGVDPSAFPPGNVPAGPPWRLLHVASLNPVKDHVTLLRALASVVATIPEVHLDIVGEDTLGGAVQRTAREAGVDDHVTFHGFTPTDTLGAFYARAHLHVVSSRHEAAGVVVLEAACAGVATVGSAVGYVADWHGTRAAGVPPGDPAALAHAIVALLRDPIERARLGAAARAWALTHDADWTAARFADLYAAVSHSAARRSGHHAPASASANAHIAPDAPK
jgi:glycosyltransferase involved in cell wall biosynthesis